MGLWALAHSPNICLFIFSNIYYYVDLLTGVAMKLHLKPDVQTFKDALSELNYKRARYRYLRKLQQQINELEITPGVEDDLHSSFLHSIQVAMDANRIFVASNEFTVYPRLANNTNMLVDDQDNIVPCDQCCSSKTLRILEDHGIELIPCVTCNGTGLLTRDFMEKRYNSLTKQLKIIQLSLTELHQKIEASKF